MTPLNYALDTLRASQEHVFGGIFLLKEPTYYRQEDELSATLTAMETRNVQHILSLIIRPKVDARRGPSDSYQVEIDYFEEKDTLQIQGKYLLDFLRNARILYPTDTESYQINYTAKSDW